MESTRTDPASASPRRPPALLAVVLAVVLEVLVLLGAAGAYLVLLVRDGTVDVLFAALTVVFAVAVAVGLLVCAQGLLSQRRWARAPVVTWQLLQSAVVAPALGGPLRTGAVALLVLGVVAVVGLFTPAVVRATDGSHPPPVV